MMWTIDQMKLSLADVDIVGDGLGGVGEMYFTCVSELKTSQLISAKSSSVGILLSLNQHRRVSLNSELGRK